MIEELDVKAQDKVKILEYMRTKKEVAVLDLIEHSGANRLRVYPLLYELQLENKLMVVEEEKLGSPKVVSLVESVRPEDSFSQEFFDWMMEQAGKNPRKRWNYNLHDSLESPAQRLLYALSPETEFTIHRHRDTAETYIVLRGSIDIVSYYDNGEEFHRIHLSKDGIVGGQMAKGVNETTVFIIALVAMPIIMWSANRFKLNWLREWSLGLVIIIGMGVGYLLTNI